MGGRVDGTICKGVDARKYNEAAIRMYSSKEGKTPNVRSESVRQDRGKVKIQQATTSNGGAAAKVKLSAPAATIVHVPTVPSTTTVDHRIALVIGNSAYSYLPRILNPRNDAEDVSEILKSLGFDVSLGMDLKRVDMEEAFIHFSRRARDADVALIFYSGHGLQYQGTTFWCP
jgi:hypothetical protein